MPAGSLQRALLVLWAFTADDGGLSFTELQSRTRLPKSTLHRLLNTLIAERLVDRRNGGYHLGRGLFELGMRASLERNLLEIATPFLEDLYERTHELVHLGVREDAEVVYVAKVGGHRQVNVPSRLGGRMPLHATAIGKVLLANAAPEVQRDILMRPLERRTPRTIIAPGQLARQLAEAARAGVAFECEESGAGTTCVAAPIRDEDDECVAAISVTGPVNRFRPRAHAAAVAAAAAGITATLARRAQLKCADP